MIKKKVKYVNFNGEEQEEEFYFNLIEPEVVRLDASFDGGVIPFIEGIDNDTNPQDILRLFEEVIKTSYGVKSKDGKFFRKTEEATADFMNSAAYGALFSELVTDVEKGSEFFNSVLTQTAVKKKEK